MNRLKERTDAQMFTSFVFPVSYIMLYNHVFCIFKIVTPHSALLEKAMAPHSGTLAWKIPWTEERGRLQSIGWLRVGHDWATSLSLSCIGEGDGNPLWCSCLGNSRDGGAWWAAVHGVAQSWT